MSIESRLEECEIILKDLGLPESVCKRKVAKLTFLALCNIKPESIWRDASKQSMTVNNDIMAFANDYYDEEYATGSRESFRKYAIHPFLEQNIILLNPDNPNLRPNSANTHYAITDLVLETVGQYGTPEWEQAINNFKLNQYPSNKTTDFQVTKVTIKNFKSIIDSEIELGRVNVFIGENGCGKSNVLEAIALSSASITNDLNFDGLYSKGVRIARPDLMVNSFVEKKQALHIDLAIDGRVDSNIVELKNSLYPSNIEEFYPDWKDRLVEEHLEKIIQELGKDIDIDTEEFEDNIDMFRLIANSISRVNKQKQHFQNTFNNILADYAIFDLNTRSLRGIIPVDSRKTPLGINGEGLDLLISTFNTYEREQLMKSLELFSWLDDIKTDRNDRLKLEGLKLGRSTSVLYFVDRFMQKQNNTLSAENSNEGILHVLFYLALFISNKTPNFFAIDNIETALNPRLCQKLIKILVVLAKERGKQVLITTHNPAILDGLNVTDEDQRLFEVYRTSEGNTRTRRIKFKSDLSDKGLKLSEMWMNGALGAVPTNF
ncbi:AAA family ATPase [Sphingobacterium sp. xlx-130]|uniref:AAA family ATPase n=1 Tax=Sphingobacterium sp. xlx-130 TaxID=2654323 RepID=UPI0013D91009|nr:AAA family ATPase [Sphingobacterium sp. xlx-130]